MQIEREQSGNTSWLRLKGRCTVEHAADLKAALVDALHSQEHLLVVLDEVNEIDLSFLQLLCSAHRTAITRNKCFALDGDLPEVFKRAVEGAGYCRVVSCLYGPDTGCLWKGGRE
jgi:ABC-type transporter Mla MlaB component